MPLPTPRPAPGDDDDLALDRVHVGRRVAHAGPPRSSLLSETYRRGVVAGTVPAMSADARRTGGARHRGGSGIGRATALEVAGRGGSVLGLDRDADGLVETTNLVSAAGGSIEIVTGDVGDEDTVAEAVARAVGAFGRLDGVVTCGRDLRGRRPPADRDVTLDTFMNVLRGEPRRHVPRGRSTRCRTSAAPTARHRQRRDDRVDRGDPRARVRRGLHREQGRRRRVHPARRGAGRSAGDARELHLPGRRRHADDGRHRSTPRSSAPGSSAPSRSATSRRPTRSRASRASSCRTTRATSPGRSSRSTAARRPRDRLTGTARRGGCRVPDRIVNAGPTHRLRVLGRSPRRFSAR